MVIFLDTWIWIMKNKTEYPFSPPAAGNTIANAIPICPKNNTQKTEPRQTLKSHKKPQELEKTLKNPKEP